MFLTLILLVACFAVLYRLRGGAISAVTNYFWSKTLGTITTRILCWVIPITVLFALAKVELIVVVSIFLTTWIGISMGHGTFQDDGTEKQTFNWFAPFMPIYEMTWPRWQRIVIDVIGMGIVNIVRGILIVCPWFLFTQQWPTWQNLWFLLPLALTGVAYYVGWRIPLNLPEVKAKTTEWGELLTGGLYGLGFWVMLNQIM